MDGDAAHSNVTYLESAGKQIWLVGTAHVAKESVDEVEKVIDEVGPDVVAVELDEGRFKALTDPNHWHKLDIFDVIKQGKMLYLMANIALGSFQRRLGAQTGVKPGAEMLAAVNRAEETGAEIALVDRNIHATLKRTWANIGFWRKAKLLAGIVDMMFASSAEDDIDIEEMKRKASTNEAMEEFTKILPEAREPLISERDRYMISSIEQLEGEKVVAVVGALHVNGMVSSAGSEVDRDALDVIPPRALWVRSLKWVIPMLILLAFSYGYVKHSGRTLEEMLTAWILPNSVFAALLTALAAAKPLSILAAFVASPITSLNPLLPAGVVVGLVEAWLRRPTVQDCERINEDVQSIGGVYKNQFTRVLLVAVMATLGSALGAWVGLGWLFTIVGGSG